MTFPRGALRAAKSTLTVPLLLVWSLPAAGLELAWPEAAQRVTGETRGTVGYLMAEGPFDGTRVPTQALDGTLTEEVWRVPGDAGDPTLLLSFLQSQLETQGYQIDFHCADRACGGFDFRYALPIADGPEMYVDLGDFHYLTAEKPTDGGAERVILTVSHGGLSGYVHLVRVLPTGDAPPVVTSSTRTVLAAPDEVGTEVAAGLIPQLLRQGSSALEDLNFETGASALSDTRYDSLVTLSEFLVENPARRIVLVGHTDAEGALDTNITLSEARAQAVRRYLIDVLGTNPAQVEARGIGYLAPRAANTSEEGREANRRVEVVLLGN